MRKFALILSLLCGMLMMACGTDSSLPVSGQTAEMADQTGLPGLPTTAPATKVTQSTNYTFTEADLIAGAGYDFSGSDLGLQSSGLSYAIVGVQIVGELTPTMLHVTGDIDSELWVGVSNYNHNYWDWQARLEEADDIPLITGDTVNDEGWFYAVIVTVDMHSCDIQLSMDMAEVTWNVMVWIAGDNNLAPDAVDDINEMESVGSFDNLDILVGYDIDPTYAPGVSGIDEVHFIKVVEDTNDFAINTTGDAANQSFPRSGYNSADPANLVSFIDWCDTTFPATHSLLILWDHGDGWLYTDGGGSGSGKRPRRNVSGVLGDDTDGAWDLTNNADIVAALGSRHFDYLCFDACNMGQIEALYEYRNLADHIVASPMMEPSGGYPYDLWLGDWQEYYPLPYTAIGTLLCARYCYYWDTQFDDGSMGHYVGDGTTPLITALSALTAEVTPKGEDEGDNVKQAILSAYKPDFSDGCSDLGDFLTAWRDLTSDTAVQACLDDASAALAEYVFTHDTTINVASSSCCVFLPFSWELTEYAESYRDTAFNQETSWLEMLEATGVPGGGDEWPTVDWAPGWKVVFEWDDPVPDIQLFIEDPVGDFGHPGDGGDLSQSITFSEDNLDSNDAEEWAELTADPRLGEYLVAINYDSFGPAGADTIDVQCWLEDDTGSLQYDFGTIPVDRGANDVWVGFLTYYGDSAGTWVPGDYVEATWGTIDAEMDLEVTDPLGNWGCCIWPHELNGIIDFSQDSWESMEPEESAALLAGGSNGAYVFQVLYLSWDGGGTPPESLPVYFKLYDSTGMLKQDLGYHMFDGEFSEGEYSDPIVLTY